MRKIRKIVKVPKPIKEVMVREKKSVHKPISREDVILLTFFGLIIVVLQVSANILNIIQWASIHPNFDSYHPLSPIFGLIAWTLYIVCMWYKKIDYWVVYVPAVIGFIYTVILLALMQGWIDTYALARFLNSFPFKVKA